MDSETKGQVGVLEHAHDRLRKMIVSGKLRGGESISESKTSRILGISRPSARELLARMEASGLVIRNDSNGRRQICEVFEREDPKVFIDRLEVRDAILSEAAFLAANKLDAWQAREFARQVEEFEQDWKSPGRFKDLCDFLLENCGNDVLLHIWKHLGLTAIDVQDKQSKQEINKHEPDSGKLMRTISEAIDRRDGAAAREAMHEFHFQKISAFRSFLASSKSKEKP